MYTCCSQEWSMGAGVAGMNSCPRDQPFSASGPVAGCLSIKGPTHIYVQRGRKRECVCAGNIDILAPLASTAAP